MGSASDFVKSKALEAIDPSEIGTILDLDVELVSPAHGNYRNKLGGALDEAKTVHWTVYVPEEYSEGEFTVNQGDLRPNVGSPTDGIRESGDGKVAILTFDTIEEGNPDNCTVVFYMPAQAEMIEELTVKF